MITWRTARNPIVMLAEMLVFSGMTYALEIRTHEGRVVDRFFALVRKEPDHYPRYYMGSDPFRLAPCRESELNERLERGEIRYSTSSAFRLEQTRAQREGIAPR